MPRTFTVDLEVSMWLEDETTSSEITWYLMTKMFDTELVCDVCETVFCSDDNFSCFRYDWLESRFDTISHFLHEMDRFFCVPMSNIRSSRTRKVRHIRELKTKSPYYGVTICFFLQIFSILFSWNILHFREEFLYSCQCMILMMLRWRWVEEIYTQLKLSRSRGELGWNRPIVV